MRSILPIDGVNSYRPKISASIVTASSSRDCHSMSAEKWPRFRRGEKRMSVITVSTEERDSEARRLQRPKAMTAVAAVLALGLTAGGASTLAAAQETKPNILFIMGDDIGWMQPSIYHEGLAVGETPN